jgi:hypothetical protein
MITSGPAFAAMIVNAQVSGQRLQDALKCRDPRGPAE